MIEIYGKPHCAFCDHAKKMLTERNIEFGYTELLAQQQQQQQSDVNYISREEFVKLFPSAKAVPQVLVDGKHLGGYPELKKYLERQYDSV
jgi:glutaredoxin